MNAEQAIHTLESVNRALEARVAELEGLLIEAGNALVPYLEEKVVGTVTIPNRALQVYNKIAAFHARL